MVTLRLIAVLVLLLLTGVGVATPAMSEPPQRLGSDVVDRAGALDGDGTAQVRAAFDRLRSGTGLQLFAVYVGGFDGADGQTWADEAARRSQLGPRDVLFAVAVDDRAYGLSVDEDFPLGESQLDDLLARDVEPRLAVGDWAGASVALADGLRDGGSSGGNLTPWLVGGTIALIGGAYVVSRRRSRKAREAPAPSGAGTAGPAPQPDGFADVSTEDLSYRASAALLDLDDAVRTSEQELDLARAQFGDEAVQEFRAALDASRAEMVRSFGVRQQLDDEVPESEPDRRAMLADIVRTCAAADARLDEQAEAFDRLRDLERRAPDVVAALAQAADAADARLPVAQKVLAELRTSYAASALTPVTDNVAQARARIAAARTEIGEARAALDAGRRGPAVVSARAAEEALAQAGTLLDGIDRLAEELEQAGARFADARAELEQDLAEARALESTGDLPAAVARAEAALAAAQRDLAAAPPDPLAALRRVTEAGATLDRAIAAVREQQVRDDRARAALDRAVLTARSSVAAAADFVTTRRGAVGREARTRLAEAQRRLDVATGWAETNPTGALQEAQQADALAQEALRLAQADVSSWSAPSGAGGAAIDLGSLVLGGILFGDGRGRGGAFGHGGRSGGFSRGGFSPGSFGGSGTRGRRGTGGRF